MLKITPQLLNNVEEYKNEFGSIGILLYAAVCKARVTILPESLNNQTVTHTSKVYNNKYNTMNL